MHLGHVLRLWMWLRVLFLFSFLFENSELRRYTWCVLSRRDSSPLKTTLEFMRRHSLAKGIIHFSVIYILVSDWSVYVGSLIFRRSVPQEVRYVFLLWDCIHEWAVIVTVELSTGRLVYTFSLSLLVSLENIGPQENSPHSIGLSPGSAIETWPI